MHAKYRFGKIALLSLLCPLALQASVAPMATPAEPKSVSASVPTPAKTSKRVQEVLFRAFLGQRLPVGVCSVGIFLAESSIQYSHRNRFGFELTKGLTIATRFVIPISMLAWTIGSYLLEGFGVIQHLYKMKLVNKNGQKASSTQRFMYPFFGWILPMLFTLFTTALTLIEYYTVEKGKDVSESLNNGVLNASLVIAGLFLVWFLTHFIWDLSTIKKKNTSERFTSTHLIDAPPAQQVTAQD